MTTAQAIIIAACIIVAESITIHLFAWFVVFRWQERWKKRNRDSFPWFTEKPTDKEAAKP